MNTMQEMWVIYLWYTCELQYYKIFCITILWIILEIKNREDNNAYVPGDKNDPQPELHVFHKQKLKVDQTEMKNVTL